MTREKAFPYPQTRQAPQEWILLCSWCYPRNHPIREYLYFLTKLTWIFLNYWKLDKALSIWFHLENYYFMYSLKDCHTTTIGSVLSENYSTFLKKKGSERKLHQRAPSREHLAKHLKFYQVNIGCTYCIRFIKIFAFDKFMCILHSVLHLNILWRICMNIE